MLNDNYKDMTKICTDEYLSSHHRQVGYRVYQGKLNEAEAGALLENYSVDIAETCNFKRAYERKIILGVYVFRNKLKQQKCCGDKQKKVHDIYMGLRVQQQNFLRRFDNDNLDYLSTTQMDSENFSELWYVLK